MPMMENAIIVLDLQQPREFDERFLGRIVAGNNRHPVDEMIRRRDAMQRVIEHLPQAISQTMLIIMTPEPGTRKKWSPQLPNVSSALLDLGF